MRGVRFTKVEQTTLVWLLDNVQTGLMRPVCSKPTERALETIRAKLLGAIVPSEESGANAGALERTLIARAMGKVVQTTPGGYARTSKVATQVGATADQMEIVGTWLARQKWLTEPVTIVMVLNKWSEWWPRAKATANPSGTSEGLSGQTGNVRPSPVGGGQTIKSGRPAQGFGR